MIYFILLLAGLFTGLSIAIIILKKMMRLTTTKIWLSDKANWSNNEIPEHCYQLVRHGKWIASKDKEN